MAFPEKFPPLGIALGIFLAVYVAAQTENDIDEQVSNTPAPYPTHDRVPSGLSFSCQSRGPGYYADPDAGCQVWHWCLPSGAKYSFLCPNGTLFSQVHRVCDWWFNVDCSKAQDNYGVNDDLYKNLEGNLI